MARTIPRASGGGGEDLAATLVLGNTTGGADIILTLGDQIIGEGGAGVGGTVTLRGGTPTSGNVDGGDVNLRPGELSGSGVDGEVIFMSADGLFSFNTKVTANGEWTLGASNPLVYTSSTSTLEIDGVPIVASGANALSFGNTTPLVYDAATGKLTVPTTLDIDGIEITSPAANQIQFGTGSPMVYNQSTGKLDVPGVIDPTAVVFTQAAAPTTGASEGGIFVSDGTGGLTAGRMYTRPPSNGTPTAIENGAIDFYANVWTAWKAPVRVATTADVASLAGGAPLTVDGVTVTTGDRILVWRQSTGSQNGIYTVTTPGTGSNGTWARASDFDASVDITSGLMVYVQEGTSNSRTRLTLTTANPLVLAVTALTFQQEAPLVRTDSTSTEIRAAGAFTSGTILWSTVSIDMRDHREVSVWFIPTSLGSNTQVDLYIQWSDDGSTIAFDDDNGVQQTDVLLASSPDGIFRPRDYAPRLTTANAELAANKIIALTFPKRGNAFRFGVRGNNASGSFSVRAMRLA